MLLLTFFKDPDLITHCFVQGIGKQAYTCIALGRGNCYKLYREQHPHVGDFYQISYTHIVDPAMATFRNYSHK